MAVARPIILLTLSPIMFSVLLGSSRLATGSQSTADLETPMQFQPDNMDQEDDPWTLKSFQSHDWPVDDTDDKKPPLKRRRIRKRKRRPLEPLWTDEEVAFDSEQAKSRRRIAPVYPFESNEQPTSSSTTETPDLKGLLRQATNSQLSLSELLQQRNLSLTELLNGDQHAIEALLRSKSTHDNAVINTDRAANYSESTTESSSSRPKTSYKTSNRSHAKIFVPFSPNKYTTVNFVPNFKHLPVTSAKMLRKQQNTHTEIPQPIKMVLNLDHTTEARIPPKLGQVTAKDEIMAVLNDSRERMKLTALLIAKNMTVDELVAHRERGSSQIYLADIFHNETREPEASGDPFVGQFQLPITTAIRTPTLRSSTSTTTTRSVKVVAITSFPTFKIEVERTTTQMPPFIFQQPPWRQLYPSVQITRGQRDDQRPSPAQVEVSRGRELSSNIPIITSSSFQSAILASCAIVSLALLVFMAILVVFKWSHKRKQRLHYVQSLSGPKMRSPFLQDTNRRTLRTFVSETLGRKKTYYKAQLQAMADEECWAEHEKRTNYM